MLIQRRHILIIAALTAGIGAFSHGDDAPATQPAPQTAPATPAATPAATPPATPRPTPPATRPATPPATAPASTVHQRVILHVNRDLAVPGQIVLEDENIITVRKQPPRSEVETFSKTRILQIVRLVDPQPDQAGVVVMRDGTIREGIVIEDTFDYVLMEIKGIRAKLKRDLVSHVVLQPTLEERYATAKAQMQPGMFEAHLEMCRWLVSQRRYDLAEKELVELQDQIDQPEARQLLRIVRAQLALNSAPVNPENAPVPEPADEEPLPPDRKAGPVIPADLLPDKLISKEDVNIIRVFEIDFDHPPKVTVTPDTVRTLIEKYGANKMIPASQTGRNAMFRAAADRPLEVVRLMFELRARDLYSQIEVNSEPHALNTFRLGVHDTWLMNNCATSRCHGGPYAGPFFLHRRNSKEDRVRYTNLLILDRLQLDPEWPLINYKRPEDSLIIQYALPRDQARKPHPEVSGWKPAFNGVNPKMKENTIDWIRGMMQPRPDYPVQYDPPRIVKLGSAPDNANPAASQPSR